MFEFQHNYRFFWNLSLFKLFEIFEELKFLRPNLKKLKLFETRVGDFRATEGSRESIILVHIY